MSEAGEGWLDPSQHIRIKRVLSARAHYVPDKAVYIETGPFFDRLEQPLPLRDRAEHGSCGNPSCPFRHCVVEPHPSAQERDSASVMASVRSSSVVWRYHVDLKLEGVYLVDVTGLSDFLSVAALDVQQPQALEALRRLRGAGVNAILIAPASGDADASLLLFCEDIGGSIKVLRSRLVMYPPRENRPQLPPRNAPTTSTVTVPLRRFRRASWRAKLWAIFMEALLVYGFGELAAQMLGSGSRLLSGGITLPVWLLTLTMTGLATGLGGLVWLQLRPRIRIARQRLRTAREIIRRLLAELDARSIQDPDTDIKSPEEHPWPRRLRWYPHEVSDGPRADEENNEEGS